MEPSLVLCEKKNKLKWRGEAVGQAGNERKTHIQLKASEANQPAAAILWPALVFEQIKRGWAAATAAT